MASLQQLQASRSNFDALEQFLKNIDTDEAKLKEYEQWLLWSTEDADERLEQSFESLKDEQDKPIRVNDLCYSGAMHPDSGQH